MHTQRLIRRNHIRYHDGYGPTYSSVAQSTPSNVEFGTLPRLNIILSVNSHQERRVRVPASIVVDQRGHRTAVRERSLPGFKLFEHLS